MKAANISLYYEKSLEGHQPFLINLVDTPGHLDFSGKVTRALRLVDGVIVVVDAVEEIVTQSETVLRQALQEGVKPVLFINKIDRLIKELKLTDEQIRKKYVRIIKDFNALIERYAEPPFDQKWKVSPADGTVTFGSALHKWGFTGSILEKSELKFKDIRERYNKETYEKEKHEDLAVYLPLYRAILEMVVDHLPNPVEAQKYRVRKIWDGDVNSIAGKAMENCDPNGPLVICTSKVQVDKFGLVVTGRIFSGKCETKKEVFLLRENNYGTIQRTAIFMGQRKEQVESIPVGNIVALEGFKLIKSGETIVDPDYIDKIAAFESVKYIVNPVITVSIEPESLRDLDKMKTIVDTLLIEDPNLTFEISESNGEFLLSGMGPLHLEVTAHDIETRGVKVSYSDPRAVFKESCKHRSSLVIVVSKNSQNTLKLTIERCDLKTVQFFKSTHYKSVKPYSKLKELLKEKTGLTQDEINSFWMGDEDQNLLLYPENGQLSDFFKTILEQIFEKIHLNGPLCGEKLTEIKISIKQLTLSGLTEENAFTELSAMFYEALKKGLKEAEPVLLEPIYKVILQIPPDLAKDGITVLSKYNAKIKDVDQKNDYQATIEALLPVRNSIKFAEEMRSTTSGKAFWQNEFYAFEEVMPHDAEKIIADLRFIKGLSW